MIVCAFLHDEEKVNVTTLSILILFFILFVGLRGSNVDNDYQNYLSTMKRGWGFAEISFFLISKISYELTKDYVGVFIIYATIGITGQIYVMYKESHNFWLSLTFFFCTYFILLDMNAIRAGAALSMAMLAWQPWSEKKHVQAILLLMLATFFHYSFIILLIAYPLIRNNQHFLNYFMLLIPLSYLIHFIIPPTKILSFFDITIVTIKSDAYNETKAGELSVFSTVILIRLTIIALLYYYKDNLAKVCDKFYLLFKLYLVGVFITITFADIPVVAMRVLDLFACSELILLPLFCEIITPRWISIAGISAYACFYFMIYALIGHYIRPYELII